MQPVSNRPAGGVLIPWPAWHIYQLRYEWLSYFFSMWLPNVILWVPCFNDLNEKFNATFECANLTVPIDYLATSGNSTTQIGMAKARPYGITQPSGILFYQDWEASYTVHEANSVGILLSMTNREYDIILVDARGSGWSNPLTCGYTIDTYQVANGAYNDAINKINSVEPPLSSECISQIIAANSILGVQNCTQNEDPQYLAHLNAPNIARDLDLIRNLSGFDTMSYYGEDYGSVIGIAYANLFPNQVGNMILNWVRDFEAWIGVNGNFLDYNFEMYSNVEDITHQFANFCFEAYEIDPKYCPLAGLSINSQDPVTDIVERMNATNDYLSKNAGGVHIPGTNGQWTFIDQARTFDLYLGSPFELWNCAQRYLELETSIQNLGTSSRIKRQVSSTSNLSFTSIEFPEDDPFPAGGFASTIIECLDSNFTRINDPDSFGNYVSKQIDDNPLVGYQSLLWNSADITCPNLTSYNPEKLPTKFSSSVRNQILIMAQTYSLGFPMAAAMNTYNFVGAENAVIFIYDGYTSPFTVGDPDDCPMNVMRSYLTEGRVPENGTVCQADYSGMNNIFVKDYLIIPQAPEDDGKKKLRIGIGIGLGLMGLIGLIILVGYWNLRRKLRQKIAHRFGISKASNLEETELNQLKAGELVK